MTTFYKFESQAEFSSLGGAISQSEYTKDGVGYSVIGDFYAPEPEWTEENPRPEDYEPIYKGFLVNTTKAVEGWDAKIVAPSAPMRIFG